MKVKVNIEDTGRKFSVIETMFDGDREDSILVGNFKTQEMANTIAESIKLWCHQCGIEVLEN
jgi:hypothetical protein